MTHTYTNHLYHGVYSNNVAFTMILAKQKSITTPLRGLSVIKHPYPGLAEYGSPWAINDAASRLWPGPPNARPGRNVLLFSASS